MASENDNRSRQFGLAALFVVQTVCGVAFMIWAKLGFSFFVVVVVVGFSASVTALVEGTVHIARNLQDNKLVKPGIWIAIAFAALFYGTHVLHLLATTLMGN